MIDVHPLIQRACELSGQSLDRFFGPDGKREIVQVRQAVCLLLHRQGLNQTQIARTVRRHHSSVQHALMTARGLVEYDKDFIRFCEELHATTL
jgi:chromosomal replication initiation ATPase DnaA